MATTRIPATERARQALRPRRLASSMGRMRVGTKLLLLAMLPVCCVVALAAVSAASDYRTAHRLSSYRAQARLSFALAPLATNLEHERRFAVMDRLDPGPATHAQLVAWERATTRAFERARARAVALDAPGDVVGGLDAARRQREALSLQLAAGSLSPEQAITRYSVLIQNVLGLAAALDRGAPSPSSARAAGAYGSLLQAIESASRERVFMVTLLAPRGDRRRPAADPWAALEAAELNAFRQNAAGRLAADMQAALFSPAGTAVQRFRDEFAADPAAATRGTTLGQWLSISGTRINALRGVAGATASELDAVVSNELDSAHARAARNLALSIAVLALVTALALALRRSIAGPLRQVSAAARGLAHGDIQAGVEYASQDEIGEVAAAFRDVHVTAARLVDEIRAKNRAVKDNRLEHRADTSGLEGVWSQLVGGMNDTMAAFVELQERREHAERETARIFEMSLDLLCVIGFDGCFKRMNPAFERTLGYSREALLSRPVFDIAHPDDRERSRAIFAALSDGKPVPQFENRNVCSDGSVRWLQWSARAVPGEALIYAGARDVTESRRAAEEQAALRRVATLVAQGVAPDVVFGTVADEMGKVLPGVDLALVARYTSDQSVEFVGGWSSVGEADWVGKAARIGGHNVSTAVFETGRPARVDHLGDDMPVTAVARGAGARSSAGAPIEIGGRLWGLMIVASVHKDRLPVGIEHELAGFTELVATAIANAQAREELAASRARVVTAADEARRRIERDLHDGVQQRLVVLGLELQAASALINGVPAARDELAQIGQGLTNVVEELREISSGIHPVVLRHGGLRAGLRALARRSPVPVDVDVPADLRLPDAVEVAAYYVASEALTNAAKHAHAASVEIRVSLNERELELAIHDDGVGGATVGAGSGLIGLADRVQAIGGRIELSSPQGGGTTLAVTLPIAPMPTRNSS